jgi:hypothetical protein
MFVVQESPTFTHSVEVLVPVDGGHDKQTFKATFQLLPADRESEFDLTTVEGSNGFLRAIVVSMDELVDAENKPIAYSDRLRDKLLSRAYVRSALVRTYYAAMTKATVGN